MSTFEDNSKSHSSQFQEGTRLVIPNFKTDFCSLIQRRFHGILRNFLGEDAPFTLFINIIDRTSKESLQKGNFIYASVETQVQILGEFFKDKPQNSDIQLATSFLSKYDLPASEGVSGGILYNEYKLGQLGLEDIQKGALKEYFAAYLKEKEYFAFENLGQQFEYPILEHFFNIDKDQYISFPLIQFAQFDGVVHMIYDHSIQKKINDDFIQRGCIKLLCYELEHMLMDYDVVGQNVYRASLLRTDLEALKSDEYYSINKNSILKDLKFQKYYQDNEEYFLKIIDKNDEVPKLLREQHRQNAIMSILIDSYAHNISAHSLTALNWWFYQRADHLAYHQNPNKKEALPAANPDISVITSNRPLAGEIHPLIKLLLEKGAFWTGLTRDRHFGGQINSLYTILRYDFVNNPLYLGTIAYSEGILKLNINITIYEHVEPRDGGILRRKKIKKNDRGELLDGQFVSIDLENINYHPDRKVAPDRLSDFVIKGDKFDALRSELTDYKIFLPGGVIGKHAFFTILENEIRNVKHYDESVIKEMRKTGLTLSLSIQEASFHDKLEFTAEHDHEMFQIGVWLNHPIQLSKKLLIDRLDRLSQDIVDEVNYAPKLGGTYQDKVCSAFLFNNTFLSVMEQESERDKKYYPWIKTGSGSHLENDYVEDYEISLRRKIGLRFQDSMKKFEQGFKEENGYFKKFFHIWKGTNIFSVEKIEELKNKWENLSRFRFVYIPESDKINQKLAKDAGIIRIIHENTSNVELAYQFWLRKWLKGTKNRNIQFSISDQIIAQIILDQRGIKFYNQEQMGKISESYQKDIDSKKYDQLLIPLAHGSYVQKSEDSDVCKYRSHGILKTRFCGGEALEDANMKEADAAELMEMLLTKVCIFDNRIANRVERSNKDILKNSLGCAIYKEELDLWKKEKEKGFNNYHFLIVHLSFIEAFKDEKGLKKYSESDITSFIEEEILADPNIDRENFILVITTGRGRTQWWTRLEESEENRSYTDFTTFRPVESLIKSIERAVSMGDDFEMKYRLTKVLFGS